MTASCDDEAVTALALAAADGNARALEAFVYADAAAVCGCPVGTIRSRVARARDALLAGTESDDLTG